MDIKKHYQNQFEKFGPSPNAVQWSDATTQNKRFEILFEIENNISSCLDVGCGTGDMYTLLLKKGFSGIYRGLDFVPEFIEYAKQKYINMEKSKFDVHDLMKDKLPYGLDYIFLSGVFNNKMNNNLAFMENVISQMFNACEKGVAFNAMSTYVDYMDEKLYYSDPCQIFDFCKKNITKKVVLRHDYNIKENSIPFEYAIYLYK